MKRAKRMRNSRRERLRAEQLELARFAGEQWGAVIERLRRNGKAI